MKARRDVAGAMMAEPHYREVKMKSKSQIIIAVVFAVVAGMNFMAAAMAQEPAEIPAPVERYRKYLEENPKVRDAITWRKSRVVVPFDKWDDKTKQIFYSAVESVEAGDETPLAAPPKPDVKEIKRDYSLSISGWSGDKSNCVDISDGRKIYFYHVAHSLKVELDRKYAWRLADFDEQDLKLLLGVENFYETMTMRLSCFILQTNWNPAYTEAFLEKEKIVKGTQDETIFVLTRWFAENLSHFHYEPGEEYLDTQARMFGRRWIPEIEQILDGAVEEGNLEHYTMGCGGTARLYREVLRSANIPVRIGISNLGGDYHNRVEFPSVGLALAHGDDPYGSYLRESPEIPAREIFYTMEELERFIDKPENIICADENGEKKCNTPGEQAAYNKSKKNLDALVRHNGLYLLIKRAKEYPARNEFPDGIEEELTGLSINMNIVVYAKPFFDEKERRGIIGNIDKRILEMGGGDWEAGLAAVLTRKSALDGKELSASEAMMAVAGAYMQKGMYVEAIEIYKKKLAADEKDFGAAKALGDVYMMVGKNPEAVAVLKKAEAGGGENAGVRAALARAYTYMGDFREAEKFYSDAPRTAPENNETLLIDAMIYYRYSAYDMEKAEKAARRLIERDNSDKNPWISGAIAAILINRNKNNTEEALSFLKKQFELEKTEYPEARALARLGGIFIEEWRDFDKADEYLKKALDISPDCVGCIMEDSYQFDPARRIEKCAKALEIKPNSIQAASCLESTYFEMKEYGKTLEYSDKLMELYGGNSRSEQAVIAFFKTGAREKALEILGSDWSYDYHKIGVTGLFSKMRIFAAAGEYDLLKEQFEIYKRKWPYGSLGYSEMARCLAETGRYEEAAEEIKTAILNNPYISGYYNELGKYYAELKRFDEAEKAVNKAMELTPKGMPYLVDLGEIYLKKGDKKKAGEMFRKAIEIVPGDMRARKALDEMPAN